MRDLKNVNSVDLSLVSTVKFGSETKGRLNEVDGSDPSDPSTSQCCFAALEPAEYVVEVIGERMWEWDKDCLIFYVIILFICRLDLFHLGAVQWCLFWFGMRRTTRALSFSDDNIGGIVERKTDVSSREHVATLSPHQGHCVDSLTLKALIRRASGKERGRIAEIEVTTQEYGMQGHRTWDSLYYAMMDDDENTWQGSRPRLQ